MGLRLTPYGFGGVLAVAVAAVVVAPTLMTGLVAGRDPAVIPKATLDAVTLPPVLPDPPPPAAIVAMPDPFQPPPPDRRLITDWSRLPPPPPFNLPSPSPLPVLEK